VPDPRPLQLPLTEDVVRSLHTGDFVLLNGTLFTARDAVHQHLAGAHQVPCDLNGSVIYHCGPVVTAVDGRWQVIAAGPTTSIREEPYMPGLIAVLSLRGIIGKGGMGNATRQACQEHGCVYFHAVGGAAQVLARQVTEVVSVSLRAQFGDPEAIWELHVRDFPVLVTMDTHGHSLHQRVEETSLRCLNELLERNGGTLSAARHG